MRFSCIFNNSTSEVIAHMFNGVAKLSEISTCILYLEPAGFEVRAVTDTSSAFGKVDAARFSSFRVQSKSNNVIVVEVPVTSLVSAFKCTESAEEACFRLTKNRFGVVCFTLSVRTLTQINVSKDVPVVRILPVNQIARYREPQLGTADATLAFPDVKTAKVVLDRMRQLDKFVQLKADQNKGNLIFRVDTEVVSTRTIFSGLSLNIQDDNYNEGNADETNRIHGRPRRNRYVAVSLNAKEFSTVVSSLIGFGKRGSDFVLAIVRGSAVCLHVSFDDESSLTYYIATAASEDEDDHLNLENNRLLRLETVNDDNNDDGIY